MRRSATEATIGEFSKFASGVKIVESPPKWSKPQVTTEPSFFNAAKADRVDAIDLTSEARFPPVGLEESPPDVKSPQVTTEPFDLRAANALAFEKIAVTPEVRFADT